MKNADARTSPVVGVRFTPEEYGTLAIIATRNDMSITELVYRLAVERMEELEA